MSGVALEGNNELSWALSGEAVFVFGGGEKQSKAGEGSLVDGSLLAAGNVKVSDDSNSWSCSLADSGGFGGLESVCFFRDKRCLMKRALGS